MCAGTPVMTEQVMGLVDELYEMRLESLLSVQDLVEAVVEALEVCMNPLQLHRGSFVSRLERATSQQHLYLLQQ